MKKIILFILLFAALWMIFTTVNVPKPGELEKDSQQLFTLINQERERLDIRPLTWDSQLAKLAANHSQYMAENDDYRHSTYPYAENIMVGNKPTEVYAAWRNSLPHYNNMIDNSLTYGGVGMGIKLTNITIGSINITINTSRSYTTFIAR